MSNRAMPAECAALIEEFLPWSDQLLDDMLHTLKEDGMQVSVQRFNPPYKSIGKIAVFLSRGMDQVKRGTYVARVRAAVSIKKNWDDNLLEMGETYSKMCSFDRAGMKEALEYVRDTVKMIKRRGLCPVCVAENPPAKRLRLSDTNRCGSCFLLTLI